MKSEKCKVKNEIRSQESESRIQNIRIKRINEVYEVKPHKVRKLENVWLVPFSF
jgi:hypothetical protein